ncbi:MAG: hypothetical protein IJV71_08425, partial [Lachnospiraceae bacterium]|nr:hypothetical protein [Lachnospiraceae bacterium]
IGYSDEHVYLDTRFFMYYYMDENKQTHQVLFDDVILWDATAKYLLSDDQLKLLYLVNIEEDLGRIVGELCLTSILGDDVGITIYDKGYFMFYYFGNEYLFKVEPSVITEYIEYIDNNSRGIRPKYISAKLDYTDKISYLPSVPWPVMQTSIDVIEDTHTEIVILPWEDRAYNSRFDSIEYSNCTYTASNRSPMYTKSFYGEQLATLEITGYDPYNDKYHTTTVTIYEDGSNPLASTTHAYTSNYALIVYFEEYDEAYYYYNESYIPDSLNEYVSNMGYIAGKQGIYKYIHDNNEYSIFINDKFYNNNIADLANYTYEILEIMGSQDVAAEVIDNFSEAPMFTIHTTCVNNLSGAIITIYIYRSGYIQFSNLDSNIFFYVTEDRVTDLIGSVLDNYFAYIPSYLVE